MTVNYNISHCVVHAKMLIYIVLRQTLLKFWTVFVVWSKFGDITVLYFEDTFIVLIVTWKFNDAKLWRINNIWGLIIFWTNR